MCSATGTRGSFTMQARADAVLRRPGTATVLLRVLLFQPLEAPVRSRLSAIGHLPELRRGRPLGIRNAASSGVELPACDAGDGRNVVGVVRVILDVPVVELATD